MDFLNHREGVMVFYQVFLLSFTETVRHVTGTGTGLLGEIPGVVVQKSALL